jgi:hypothetical protein
MACIARNLSYFCGELLGARLSLLEAKNIRVQPQKLIPKAVSVHCTEPVYIPRDDTHSHILPLCPRSVTNFSWQVHYPGRFLRKGLKMSNKVKFLEKLHSAVCLSQEVSKAWGVTEMVAHECLREAGLLNRKLSPEQKSALTTVVFVCARGNKGALYELLCIERAWSAYSKGRYA